MQDDDGTGGEAMKTPDLDPDGDDDLPPLPKWSPLRDEQPDLDPEEVRRAFQKWSNSDAWDGDLDPLVRAAREYLRIVEGQK